MRVYGRFRLYAIVVPNVMLQYLRKLYGADIGGQVVAAVEIVVAEAVVVEITV